MHARQTEGYSVSDTFAANWIGQERGDGSAQRGQSVIYDCLVLINIKGDVFVKLQVYNMINNRAFLIIFPLILRTSIITDSIWSPQQHPKAIIILNSKVNLYSYLFKDLCSCVI